MCTLKKHRTVKTRFIGRYAVQGPEDEWYQNGYYFILWHRGRPFITFPHWWHMPQNGSPPVSSSYIAGANCKNSVLGFQPITEHWIQQSRVPLVVPPLPRVPLLPYPRTPALTKPTTAQSNSLALGGVHLCWAECQLMLGQCQWSLCGTSH